VAAHVVDGRAVARRLKAKLAAEVEQSRCAGADIGLATLPVGGQFGATAYEPTSRRSAPPPTSSRAAATRAEGTAARHIRRIIR
jgi:hypothetical protein